MQLQPHNKNQNKKHNKNQNKNQNKRQARNRAKTLFAPLPKRKYEIILADPCWDYKGQTQHNGKGGVSTGGALKHYPTLTLSQLKQLDVPSITKDNALIFLWATSPHLDQAIELGKHWGFSWATQAFVWVKQQKNGKDLATNPGFYTLSQIESCLVMKKGKIPQPRGARNIRQCVFAPRERHSAKPEEVRERIEKMFPTQKKIELFARQRKKGWTAWGLEM